MFNSLQYPGDKSTAVPRNGVSCIL